METLLDLLEDAAERYRRSSRRSGCAARTGRRRLELPRGPRRSADRGVAARALGLEPGDRVLTWSPSTPELPAAYFGAMSRGLIYVPLDLRMAPDAIQSIVESSGATRLLLGTGRDAPDPREVGLERFPTTIDRVAGSEDPDDTFPADWEAQVAAWPRPQPDDLFELVFTSGTTGNPKGVMLAHDNVLAGEPVVPPDHPADGAPDRVAAPARRTSLEQAVGAVLRDERRRRRPVRPEPQPAGHLRALREHRVTSMVVVPQVLDLFWSAIEREVEKSGPDGALRSPARRSLGGCRLGCGGCCSGSVHAQLGGALRLFVTAGAFLPPALQQAWEDMGVTVLQGYGATETGAGCGTTMDDHRARDGRAGRRSRSRCASPRTARSSSAARRLFKGYWNDPEATAAAFTEDGWYRTGDVGAARRQGPAHPARAQEGHHRPAERLQRVPRGHRERAAHRRDPRLGRARDGARADRGDRARRRAAHPAPGERSTSTRRSSRRPRRGATIDAAVKAANPTLGPNQRIAGWRLWPEADFPRTHTLKVKRDLVRAWATDEAPLPVSEGAAASG